MDVKKNSKPLSGIKCVVNSCYYNESNHCHAQEIEVQSPNAETIEMTDCATFEPKG